jgi:hypothetical protein
MNGWQRLWVLASFLLGVGTAVMCYGSMKTESGLTTSYKTDLVMRDMEIENIKRRDAGVKSTNKYEQSDRTVAEVEASINKVTERYRQDLEQLPANQLKHVSLYLGGWLGACAFIYLVGMMLNWVYRGFRPKAV